jgi:sterol-4alpha-carboxylate 3-dehydrogenase (decarboxylating)
MPSASRRVLVTGGSGFLGRHLLQTLIGLGHSVRCFDILPANHDSRVVFFQGDITSEEDQELLEEACQDVDTVFHTASLTDPLASFDAIWRVNVLGTENVLRAAMAAGVRNLIYTSTTAVIFNGRSIEGACEADCPYPRAYLDPYSQCKAEAEQIVMKANGAENSMGQTLCTVSLRPHAIFGPRDTHFISKLISRARNGDITHMIGSGDNKVDFTYIGNVVHALIITMHQLSDPDVPLEDDLPSPFLAARSRIGGQAYFITNGEPRPFWSFVNTILSETGCVGPTKKISFSIAYFIATVMEWVQWLLSRLPSFMRFRIERTITRHMVCIMGRSQWYSCEKAQRDLGYTPIVTLDQGLEITIQYFFRRKNVKLLSSSGSSTGSPSNGYHQHHHTHAQHGNASASPPVLQSVGAPKFLTRIHSVPTPAAGYAPAEGHPTYAEHHAGSQTVGVGGQHRPIPMHPSDAPFSSPPQRVPGSPTHRWPHRHWSSSPPFDERAAAHAGPNAMHPQQMHAHLAAPMYGFPHAPSSRHHTSHHPGYVESLPAHAPPHLYAPNPQRAMRTVPSSMFLNAYSHPGAAMANAQPQPLSASSSGVSDPGLLTSPPGGLTASASAPSADPRS